MYKGEEIIVRLLAKAGKMDLCELENSSNMNIDALRRIVESLKGEGYATVESTDVSRIIASDELIDYGRTDLPECRVFAASKQSKKVSELSGIEKQIGLQWAKKKGFVSIEGGVLKPNKEDAYVAAESAKVRKAIEELGKKGSISDLVLLDELFTRNLVKKKTEKQMVISYTGKEIGNLEHSFDISIPSADADVGKAHVITQFKDKVRSIMSEMGFEEMDGSIMESTFWNFDALFQPQDHPARDLADTFYLEGESPLPDDQALVKRVKESHEKGWKYKWSESDAKRTVLRTHTTALSARCLAGMKDKKPKKFFAVGRVFRNEATDYKHLAEFHQVEGIIAADGATFGDLLGIIKEFYRKLGFEKIRFRPSYFPYTEPSLEIEVFFEPKQQWLELGGAGIFRPEVSIPLAGIYPVLAWGLSLERPLMLELGLVDIRTFYRNNIDFLKNTRNATTSTTKKSNKG